MGPRLLFFIGYYLYFLKILNKLFNNICYKLATDLGYTYTGQPVNEGYEILKRKFNLYFDFYYRRLKTILVNPELWIIFILLILLFSFLRFMYLFCSIFLCLLLLKDLLFYRFSNQKELRPKTYGNLYFIECDMNNHQHISLKNSILLIYNLTFRDAQVGAFKFTYYILKYLSKLFMVPFTWVSLVVIFCTLVIWFKKFSYIIPLIAFCKAWRWTSCFSRQNYVSQLREVFNNNHLCRKIIKINKLRIYKDSKSNWNFNPHMHHYLENMKRTSAGYKLYTSLELTTLIHWFREEGRFYFGDRIGSPRHFMWAINLGINNGSIFFANNLTSKQKLELFMEFKLNEQDFVSGMVSKVLAPGDLIYMEKIENSPQLSTGVETWMDSHIAEYSAVLSLFNNEISYKILQKSSKAFGLVGGNLPLTQLVRDCGYEMRPDLSNNIEKILNYKLLLDYSNLSEIEKSYFVYAYILDNPREFEGLSNILVTDSPFYELDTKLKGVVTPNDFLENITE